MNPVPGTTLPESGGLSIAPPVAIAASGDATSATRSGISAGTVTVTDDAKQQALTGQSAADIVANLNRNTSDAGGALSPIFDKQKIEAGFEITSQLVNQVGTFVANRVKEADAASAAAKDPGLTPEQRAAAQQKADELNKDWGPNGTYRQALTALTVAAGGNVTGGMGQYAQAATVAYIQELGANGVKQLITSLNLDRTPEGETARAALQTIVGCAGAAASSANCGAGAMGAAASSVIGSLLAPTENMSAADRLVRENLVNSLVAGLATGMGASGADMATAAGAAQIEVQNNQVGILAPKKNPLATDLVKTFCATGTCTDEQVKQLVAVQNQMNDAVGKNAVMVAGSAGAVALMAAIPVLASLAPEALALALANPAAAVNAGIITAETAAAIVTNSVTPGVVIEGAAIKGANSTRIVANEVDAVVDSRKFSDYIFKPGADHGKNIVFESLGYTLDDSATLAKIWETQAAQRYASGEFTLGKADQYGQRINIEIALPGKGSSSGQTSYLQSGWMIQPDGSLKLNTPFAGFTRGR